MRKNKDLLLIDLKDWDESVKKQIESISFTLDDLIFYVCWKSSEEFEDEKKTIKKIERILKTKKIQFFYNLPF